MGSTTGAEVDGIEDPAELRVRVFALIQDLQSGTEEAASEIARIASLAEDSGFDRVVRAGLYGRAIEAWISQDGGLGEALEALIRESRLHGDGAMAALGLGMRAAFLPGPEGDLASPAYDADLAEATVLLEEVDGPALERISAHTSCGVAFDYRSLWELADEQYAAAMRLGHGAEPEVGETLLAAVMFNRAEAHVSWAGRLLQVGDQAGIASRWRSWQAVAARPDDFSLPTLWRNELWALGQLMAAIAGQDVSRDVETRLATSGSDGTDEPRARSHLMLADALSAFSCGHPGAAAKAGTALEAIDPEVFPQMYDLGLFLAARIEAGDGRDAGLRCAHRHIRHRWADRLARLGAMSSRIEQAHLEQEVKSLAQVANLDELTGIANRRGLAGYVEDLPSKLIEEIAVVMVDVDDFKLVNDGHGHSVGDEVLVRIASLLRQSVRPVDIAARLGGDEFVLLIANAGEAVGLQRAERIMAGVADQSWEDLSPGLTVSVSIGVAAGKSSELEILQAQADRAAYRAKRKPGSWITCHPAERSARALGDEPR